MHHKTWAVSAIFLCALALSACPMELPPIETDQTPPLLNGTLPGNGSVTPVDTRIELTFSEPLNPSQVTVTLSPATANLGDPSWSNDNRTVTFTPTPLLRYGTDYTLRIQGKDVAGNALATTTVGFTTQHPPDTTPPTVKDSTPANNVLGVDINAHISLSFSEPMDTASVTSAFSIFPQVVGTLLWNVDRTLLTFDPTAPLDYSKLYTVTLGTGAMDPAGNRLASPYSFKFTTGETPDLTRPRYIAYSPNNLQTGLGRSTNVSVTFSEPMDKASTQNALSIISPSGISGSFSWSADGKTMTFTPSTLFDHGTDVIWHISASARDLAGNMLEEEFTARFKIIRQFSVNLPLVSGSDGYISYDIVRKTYTVNANTTPALVGLSYTFEFTGYNYIFYPIAHRAFMTFDLSSLPADLTSITDASLNVYFSNTNTEPFSRFGDLNVSSVGYGSTLDASDYTTTSVFGTTTWRPGTIGWNSTAIRSAVDDDWRNQGARGKRTQLRLHFNVPDDLTTRTEGNDVTLKMDSGSAANKPYISVTYEIP